MSFVWFSEAMVKFKSSRMFLSGIFWCECCSSFSSCCDRDKTKSTPSPRTLDWSVTKVLSLKKLLIEFWFLLL